tara:strand:- start:4179 stop:4397 length:219 start_codon:yes stop_codon:yes gene_type:complete
LQGAELLLEGRRRRAKTRCHRQHVGELLVVGLRGRNILAELTAKAIKAVWRLTVAAGSSSRVPTGIDHRAFQ